MKNGLPEYVHASFTLKFKRTFVKPLEKVSESTDSKMKCHILLKWTLAAILVGCCIQFRPVYSQDQCEEGEVEYPSPAEDGTTICVTIEKPPGTKYSYFWPNNPSFYLFTSENPDERIELNIHDENAGSIASQIFEKAPRFNVNAPLKILIHGYLSSSENPFPKKMMHAYLDQRNEQVPNVILVDWSDIAGKHTYPIVVKFVQTVGEETADLIEKMVQEQLTRLDKIHIVGHSLGAHAAGFAGATIQSKGLGKISRITGLDPAGPQFCKEVEGRLDPSDAEFVDVIHTDDGDYCGLFGAVYSGLNFKLGHSGTLGHVDFYPNGGADQPGCSLIGACNHSRAHALMAMSIRNPTAFVGHECPNWDMFTSGKCDDSVEVRMGEYTPRSARGKYYLSTGDFTA